MTERKLKSLEWHEKNGRHWLAVSPTNRVYSILKNNAGFGGVLSDGVRATILTAQSAEKVK